MDETVKMQFEWLLDDTNPDVRILLKAVHERDARIRELEAQLRNAEQNRDMAVRAVHAQTEHVRNLEALVEEARDKALREAIAAVEAHFERLPNYTPNAENNLPDKVEEGYGNAILNAAASIRALLARMGGEHDRS